MSCLSFMVLELLMVSSIRSNKLVVSKQHTACSVIESQESILRNWCHYFNTFSRLQKKNRPRKKINRTAHIKKWIDMKIVAHKFGLSVFFFSDMHVFEFNTKRFTMAWCTRKKRTSVCTFRNMSTKRSAFIDSKQKRIQNEVHIAWKFSSYRQI